MPASLNGFRNFLNQPQKMPVLAVTGVAGAAMAWYYFRMDNPPPTIVWTNRSPDPMSNGANRTVLNLNVCCSPLPVRRVQVEKTDGFRSVHPMQDQYQKATHKREDF